MTGGFAEAASGGEASHASNRVAKRQPWSKGVKHSQRGKAIVADVPGGSDKCGEQSAGKNAARLHGVPAENLSRIRGVVVPVHQNVKSFRSNDSGQHRGYAKVPRVVAIDPLALGKFHADHEADEHAERDQKSIGGRAETSEMKEGRKHLFNWMQTVENLHCAV